MAVGDLAVEVVPRDPLIGRQLVGGAESGTGRDARDQSRNADEVRVGPGLYQRVRR